MHMGYRCTSLQGIATTEVDCQGGILPEECNLLAGSWTNGPFRRYLPIRGVHYFWCVPRPPGRDTPAVETHQKVCTPPLVRTPVHFTWVQHPSRGGLAGASCGGDTAVAGPGPGVLCAPDLFRGRVMIETEATRKKFLKEREVAAAALRRALKMRTVTKVPPPLRNSVTKLPHSVTKPVTKLPAVTKPWTGRPRSHLSNAERQRQYRLRKKHTNGE